MGITDKILIIAPCRKIADVYYKIFKRIGIKIDIEVVEEFNYGTDAKKFIDKINSFKDLGKEIVVTRGLLSKQLKEEINMNIIAIDVSDYDVLKVMYKYRDFKGPIGVVECDIFTEKIKKIAEMLGVNVHLYAVEKIQDFEKLTSKAIDDGMELLIGSSWIDYDHERISKMGVKYDIIESSEFAIEESLKNAFTLYEMIFEEKRKNEVLKTILEFSIDGIISIDSEGYITTFNPSAEKIFQLEVNSVIGRHIDNFFPQIKLSQVLKDKKSQIGEVYKNNNNEIVINKVPMIVNNEVIGAIATFQKVRDVQDIENKVRCELSKRGLEAKHTFNDIIGKSNKMLNTIAMAKAFSKVYSTILITGETGTGKEILAQSIHNESNRRNSPFVPINCSALPENLLESELFGYCEGAFTGAKKGGKQGIFELAHRGTIFLDEIGEISLSTQARLLRVLQEKEVMRIGDDKVLPVDVRIIAATNRDLQKEVEKGRFRADLYYRLNVLNIKIPSLRERKEDITSLVDGLMKRLNMQLQCNVLGLDDEILVKLMDYNWPGNIRELENILEKIIVITRNGVSRYRDLEFIFQDIHNNSNIDRDKDIYNLTLEQIEMKVIKKVFKDESFNKSKTAQRLGIDRSTLSRKLERY